MPCRVPELEKYPSPACKENSSCPVEILTDPSSSRNISNSLCQCSTGFPTEEDRMFATINGESCVVPYYLTTNVKKLHRTLFDQDEYEPSPTVEEINENINAYVN